MSFYLNRACRYPNVQRTERLTEKTVFKDEWTEKYVFILPQSSTESLFLICTETVGVTKSGNVKRHYDTKHRHFEQLYPQNTKVRTAKLWQLKSSYESMNSKRQRLKSLSKWPGSWQLACWEQPDLPSFTISPMICEGKKQMWSSRDLAGLTRPQQQKALFLMQMRAVAGFSGHLRRCAYFGCHLGCCIIVLFTGHGLIISTALFTGEQTDSCRHWSDQSVSQTRLRLFDVY